MKPHEVIEQLQNTNSRNEKEEIISQAWENGCVEFFEGVKLAYDSLKPFHVKQVPKIESDENEEDFQPDFDWNEFKQLAEKLHRRELTGHDARDALHDAAQRADVNEWNMFMRRVLLKDLRAGIKETTTNKVLRKKAKQDSSAKNYILTKFGCQLADKMDEHGKDLEGTYYVDQKFDGVRVLTILDKEKGIVYQLSREGKPLENFTHLVQGFENMMNELPGSLVLDGEVISRTFQDLMKQVHRKKNVDANDAKLALFDVVPLDEFNSGKSEKTQEQRHQVLCDMQGLFQDYLGKSAFVVPKKKIGFGTEKGRKEFDDFLAETVSAGYEGLIVKDPKSYYQTKRTKDWLKWKPTVTIDLEVVDVEEGTGRNQNRLGTLVCKGEYEGKQIYCNIGTGFSDEQREEIWKDTNSVIGQIIEVISDGLSQNQDAQNTYSLRFPRFVRFRGFEKGEKI